MAIVYSTVPPKAVRHEPAHVQKAYVREFERVEDLTGDVLCAKNAADKLLLRIQYVNRKKVAVSKRRGNALVNKSMDVRIFAHISEMSASDCISSELLQQIKRTDPHPFLVVYDVGGEGVSSGKIDHKKERKIWSFRAIKELSRRIKEGAVGIIHGHNAPGEDIKRKVGRVIHSFTKTIKDSLHALAVAHITDSDIIDDIKSGKLNICSIEGNVLLAREDKFSTWFVKDVDKITNLAIGSSSVNNPGFSGAGVLATIQEMNKE